MISKMFFSIGTLKVEGNNFWINKKTEGGRHRIQQRIISNALRILNPRKWIFLRTYTPLAIEVLQTPSIFLVKQTPFFCQQKKWNIFFKKKMWCAKKGNLGKPRAFKAPWPSEMTTMAAAVALIDLGRFVGFLLGGLGELFGGYSIFFLELRLFFQHGVFFWTAIVFSTWWFFLTAIFFQHGVFFWELWFLSTCCFFLETLISFNMVRSLSYMRWVKRKELFDFLLRRFWEMSDSFWRLFLV